MFDEAIAGASYRRLAERLDIAQGRYEAHPSGSGPNAPAFVLAVGDQVYMDSGVTRLGSPTGLSVYETPYRDWLGHPAMRSVFSRIPLYPMLDDHEFRDGYVPGRWQGRPDRCLADLYQAYQRQLAPAPAQTPWYTLNKGGFPFFVMDTRTGRGNRRPAGMPGSSGDRIIGEEQMRAVKAWLLKQRDARAGTPLFLVSPCVVFPMHRHVLAEDAQGRQHLDPLKGLAEDGWEGFPASLDELLHFIAQERIEQVVFLSGDYHLSCVARMRVRCPSHRDEVAITSIVSSGTYVPYRATVSQRRALALDTDWIEGRHAPVAYRYSTEAQMITDAHNVAVITASLGAKGQAATLSISFDSADGPLRHTLSLAEPAAHRSPGTRQRHV